VAGLASRLWPCDRRVDPFPLSLSPPRQLDPICARIGSQTTSRGLERPAVAGGVPVGLFHFLANHFLDRFLIISSFFFDLFNSLAFRIHLPGTLPAPVRLGATGVLAVELVGAGTRGGNLEPRVALLAGAVLFVLREGLLELYPHRPQQVFR